MTLPQRHGSTDVYRYGFQGQEKDDEVKGEGNSYNYKFRMHDPRIGRFFAVDPLAHAYPWYTPYQFSGNTPIMSSELEGLEPEVNERGELVGYTVQRGQGPTQIAEDINNPDTQETYGYTLQQKIDWIDVVYDNQYTFMTKTNVSNFENKYDKGYNNMNIDPGDYLIINAPCGSLKECPQEQGDNDTKPIINDRNKVLVPTSKITMTSSTVMVHTSSNQTGPITTKTEGIVEVWLETTKVSKSSIPKTGADKQRLFFKVEGGYGYTTTIVVWSYSDIQYRERNIGDGLLKLGELYNKTTSFEIEGGDGFIKVYESWEEYEKATNGKGPLIELRDKIESSNNNNNTINNSDEENKVQG